MARCSFSIDISDTPEELIRKAKAGITQANGSFDGDTNQGSFRVPTPLGAISGTYEMEASAISIAIQNKPMLLSCSRIESELRKFMG